MKDWKTTTAAAITAVFGFIVAFPHNFDSIPVLIDIAKFAALGGLVAFGITAADVNPDQ